MLRVSVHNEPGSSCDDEAPRCSIIVLPGIVEAENEGFVHVAEAAPSDGITNAVGLLVGNHRQVFGHPFARLSCRGQPASSKSLRHIHRSFGVEPWNRFVGRVVERQFFGKFLASSEGFLTGDLVDGLWPSVPRHFAGHRREPQHPAFGEHLQDGLGVSPLPAFELRRCCKKLGGFVNADRLETVHHQHQLIGSDDTRAWPPHHRFNFAHHGPLGHDRRLEQVVNVPRNDVATAHPAQPVIGTPHALQHTVHRFGRVNLHDTADAPDVDAQLEAGRAHQSRKSPVAQLIFHLLTRLGRQRPVMHTDLEVRCQRLKPRGQGLCVASTVHEHQTGRLGSQNVTKVAISGVLLGTEGSIDGPDFILGKRRR